MPLHATELPELRLILGETVGRRLSEAPGGWRSLSREELERLVPKKVEAVLALQKLTAREHARPCVGALTTPEDVARVYSDWLGSLDHEIVVALALDAQNHLVQELELARGGAAGVALRPGDIFRPLLRAGARCCILLHNHPSGDPTPSIDDIRMTEAVSAVGNLVGIPLLDHIVVGAHGGGWASVVRSEPNPQPE
jgi:DNA repair protein RadC